MAIATFPFKLKDYELAAYELSNTFIRQGYITDVYAEDDGYVTLIYKERYLHNVIGSPVFVKTTFKNTNDETDVTVETVTGKVDAKRVIKDTIMVITILPGVGKLIEANTLKRKVKRAVAQIVYKYKENKLWKNSFIQLFLSPYSP